ncbi:insulinase family protein [bacterium]|nr:MAG: insulinase family protein [bacterium]
MIFALILALQKPALPVEVIQEPGEEIRFEAAILLPSELDREDRAELPALAAAMAKATQDYPPSVVTGITDGRPLRVEILADSLRISFGVNSNAEGPGVDLLSSILLRPRLGEGMKAEKPRGFYTSILTGGVVEGLVSSDELSYLFGQIIRPERMRIAVAGPVAPGIGEKIAGRLTAFPSAVKANPYRKRQSLPNYSPEAGNLVLRSPSIPYSAPDLSARLIAWTALGVGKGSALFRTSRERLGMSYRQEAILLGTPEGFVPTLLVATDKPDAEALRKALLEDIEGWTDDDVSRAKGILRANQETSLPLSPLLVSSGGPPTNDAADRAFLAAYWPLRTGRAWDQLYWAVDVSLDDMKKLAREAVTAAK